VTVHTLCPAGKRAVSGGYGADNGVAVIYSGMYLNPPDYGWTIEAVNNTSFARMVRGNVICASLE
jgi:hypothetical protein